MKDQRGRSYARYRRAVTKSQLAVMRSLTIIGAVLLITGIGLIIYDMSNPEEVCTTTITGWENCKEHVTNRGLWLAGGAVLLIIATFVAWSTLTPKDRAE